MFWFGVVVGSVIGAFFGVFAVCLVIANREASCNHYWGVLDVEDCITYRCVKCGSVKREEFGSSGVNRI